MPTRSGLDYHTLCPGYTQCAYCPCIEPTSIMYWGMRKTHAGTSVWTDRHCLACDLNIYHQQRAYRWDRNRAIFHYDLGMLGRAR